MPVAKQRGAAAEEGYSTCSVEERRLCPGAASAVGLSEGALAVLNAGDGCEDTYSYPAGNEFECPCPGAVAGQLLSPVNRGEFSGLVTKFGNCGVSLPTRPLYAWAAADGCSTYALAYSSSSNRIDG